MVFQGFESKVAFVEIHRPLSTQDTNKGIKKMTSQELFMNLNGKGKKEEHTQEERIIALVDSMRNYPTWWEKRIPLCEIAPKQITIAFRDPWGGIGFIEASDLINLWNEVKVAA